MTTPSRARARCMALGRRRHARASWAPARQRLGAIRARWTRRRRSPTRRRASRGSAREFEALAGIVHEASSLAGVLAVVSRLATTVATSRVLAWNEDAVGLAGLQAASTAAGLTLAEPHARSVRRTARRPRWPRSTRRRSASPASTPRSPTPESHRRIGPGPPAPRVTADTRARRHRPSPRHRRRRCDR